MRHIKNILESHHFGHMSGHHHMMAAKFEHLIHDESFWATVVALALIAIFIGIAIWATISGQQSPRVIPAPYYPYGF